MTTCTSVQDWLSFGCQVCSEPFALSNAAGLEYSISLASERDGEAVLARADNGLSLLMYSLPAAGNLSPLIVKLLHDCTQFLTLTGLWAQLHCIITQNLLAVYMVYVIYVV